MSLRKFGRFSAALVCGFGLAGTDAHAQSAAWQTTANADFRYFTSRNSLGATASQIYLPFGAQLNGRPSQDWKMSFLVRSGAIFSRQTSPTATSEVNTLTDTNMTPSVTYLGWNGITPTLSVAMNIPTATGHASSTVTNSNSKTDADLVPTPSFGEGFNVGPTLSTNFNLSEMLVLGVGVGYTYRGPFDQGTLTGISRFDPGDVATFNLTLNYRGERLSLQGTASYSAETTTEQGGIALYRAGDRVMLGAKAGYAWSQMWSSRVAVNFSHFMRNNVQPALNVNPLVVEAFNSNSDVTKVTLDTTYNAGVYSIGPTLSYLYRNRNGYDPTTFQFLPAKTAWGVGVNGSYTVTNAIQLTASVQRQWVKEAENPTKVDALNAVIPGSAVPEASTRVWTAQVGGTVKF